MEALVSSVQLVGTIEESVSRVTDLVKAVKKYAYEDKPQRHQLDVHDSLQSTLIILGHKFRTKELTVEKVFAANFPSFLPVASGSARSGPTCWTMQLTHLRQKGTVIRVRTWH